MAINAFLLVSVLVMAIVMLVLAVFLVIYFGHPDDRTEAKFPKVIVVFGIWLAFASVLILPYDVASSKSTSNDSGGIRVDVLWQIAYICMACMVVFIIPFAFYYYEAAEDEEGGSQIVVACKSTIMFIIVFIIFLICFFVYLAVAEVPVIRVAVPGATAGAVIPVNASFSNTGGCSVKRFVNGATRTYINCVLTRFIWDIPVTFPIYVMAFISFIGWFFFALFVGVGMVALPMDFINEYKTRPEKMEIGQYIQTKKELGRRAAALLEVGIALQNEARTISGASRSEKRRHQGALKSFEQNYYFLKRDVEVLKISYELKGGNPIWYIIKLIIGTVGGIISLTWILHILIFMLPANPPSPFLNDFFVATTENVGGFPLFGVVFFAIWSTYLLWCCVKGNFKLGVRLLFIKVYPMELGNTLMNAFLVNTWIILVCAIPTVQFCTQAFPIYTRFTQVDLLFGTQIKYLRFFKYFFANDVFIFGMLILFFISVIWLTVRPKDTAAQIEAKINKVAGGAFGDNA